MSRTKAEMPAPEVVGNVRPMVTGAGNYFTNPKTDISFVKSGCTLLDCALGGGWALGRIANIVGDKSTAKTALAVEALTNFVRDFPNGRAAYRDAEAAFDLQYAEAMGLPLGAVDFGPEDAIATVEAFAADLDKFLNSVGNGRGIYILDSLDALTSESELKNDLGDQGYGQAKAKLLSELFRRMTRKIESSNVLLLIVSQVRDNIGAMFGEKHKRSGGRALDFFASQVVWLARLKTLNRTIQKVTRAYGVEIKANVKKNKVGLPHRTCEFKFLFGYGIEDMDACLEWLDSIGRLDGLTVRTKQIESMTDEEYRKLHPEVVAATQKVWAETETTFLPKRRKYE